MKKPLAPYGTIVKELLRFKPSLPIYIFVGKEAYQEARKAINNATPCMCLPLSKHIDDYDWPVEGGNFILFDTGGATKSFLYDCAYYFLSHGAQKIIVYTEISKVGIEIFTQKDL